MNWRGYTSTAPGMPNHSLYASFRMPALGTNFFKHQNIFFAFGNLGLGVGGGYFVHKREGIKNQEGTRTLRKWLGDILAPVGGAGS